ncbi:hypothetical protein PAMP_019380 [Pampus punctatissimus]
MKTLCFILGLLLLTTCCNATSLQEAMLDTCCFTFSTQIIPLRRISAITKTHQSCPMEAFIVQTMGGRAICYSQTSRWALHAYYQLHNTESSIQQS